MNINRNNYEEYFILYMDNELGIDDRREVEEFVQRHPDLKEELDILILSKFSPDKDIVFKNKEELVMKTDPSINLSNYEEWLVMYIDDELNAEQRKDVEQFATLHPHIQEGIELLQQTILQAEKEIVFPDRESLYRRTEKAPVIYFNWRRIAVAAVLLIAVGTTALLVYNKKPAAQTEEIVSAPTQEQKTITPVAANKETNQKIDQPVIANNVQQSLAQTKQKPAASTKNNFIVNKKQPDNLPEVKKEELVADNKQKPSNNLPRPVNVVKENNDAIAANSNTSDIKDPLTNDRVTTITPQPSQAVYNPAANDDDLNQSGGKKNKLRGLLRKVTRTLEKNTNINATDDDRLLVGGLSFKLK